MSGTEIAPATGKGRLQWLWRASAAVLLVATLLAGGGAVCLALPSRSNHIGYDIRGLWVLSALAALHAGIGFWARADRKWAIALLVAGGALAVTVGVLDYGNLLVGYEEWVERGMPERWSR